jgi:hypothetical protein
MPRTSKKSELKIVLDSSAIFTDSPSDLLRNEVAELAASNANHPELTISWYLPAVVAQEREYQMRKRGVALLPAITKLERVLGNPLNITADLVARRIAELVESQASQHGLTLAKLDVEKVDWSALIRSAVERLPPFDPGDTEKGFRDAVVLETLAQIVADAPATPQVCRVAFVAPDGLLSEAAKSRFSGVANVRVFRTIDELRELINTLVSQVSEEFVAKWRLKAEKLFYTKGEKRSLYYTGEIPERIQAEFSAKVRETPPGATRRVEDGIALDNTQFVKKDGQTIHWSTRVSMKFKTFIERQPSRILTEIDVNKPLSGVIPADAGAMPTYKTIDFDVPPGTLSGITYSFVDPQGIIASNVTSQPGPTGRTGFDVYWSTRLTTAPSLRDAKVDRIEYAGTVLDK